MAIKIQNITSQVIPIVVPHNKGGEQVNIQPRKTIILAVDRPTEQITSLIKKGKLRLKK